MMFEAVIFDLDGVICHTDQYHYMAWKTVADELHIPFDKQINNRLRGVSRRESFDIILERCSGSPTEEEKSRYIEKKNQIYRDLLWQMSPDDLEPSVLQTLRRLRGKKVRLAIGSSSKNTALILERIGLGGFFDAVCDGTQITRSKPDPEVFLKAANMLAIPPEACLVVEDAQAGLKAAHAGGMKCAALGPDATGSKLADYNLSCFSDLLALFA
jgi:beta-phosphoglucomutase